MNRIIMAALVLLMMAAGAQAQIATIPAQTAATPAQAAAVSTATAADTAAAVPAGKEQAQMPTEFMGCRLGATGREEAKGLLEGRKLTVVDYDGSLVVQNAVLGGFRFSAAMLDFNELGVMERITYLNSGLSKQEALDFSNALHAVLDSRYITVKTVIDGLDCYFASVGGVTCQLATKASSETSYFVSLSYELGVPVMEEQH